MEFQRRGDIREAIKIGSHSASHEVYHLSIRVYFPIKDTDRTKQIMLDIKDSLLEELLKMLDSEGLNLKFHEKIMDIARQEFLNRNNIPRLFDMKNVGIVNAHFSAIPCEDNEKKKKQGFTYAEKLSIPSLFGKMVKFGDSLYEIKDDTENPGYWND